jgi:hypothetical protein
MNLLPIWLTCALVGAMLMAALVHEDIKAHRSKPLSEQSHSTEG